MYMMHMRVCVCVCSAFIFLHEFAFVNWGSVYFFTRSFPFKWNIFCHFFYSRSFVVLVLSFSSFNPLVCTWFRLLSLAYYITLVRVGRFSSAFPLCVCVCVSHFSRQFFFYSTTTIHKQLFSFQIYSICLEWNRSHFFLDFFKNDKCYPISVKMSVLSIPFFFFFLLIFSTEFKFCSFAYQKVNMNIRDFTALSLNTRSNSQSCWLFPSQRHLIAVYWVEFLVVFPLRSKLLL